MPVVVIVLTAIAILGCSETAPCPTGETPSVTLGTGLRNFEPLTEGAQIEIVQGPQGGYHFFGSVHVTGLDQGDPTDLSDARNPTTEFRVFHNAMRVDALASRYTQGLLSTDDCTTFAMIGRLVILDIADDDQLAGKRVRFEVEVTDTRGRRATDVRELMAHPHPGNQ